MLKKQCPLRTRADKRVFVSYNTEGSRAWGPGAFLVKSLGTDYGSGEKSRVKKRKKAVEALDKIKLGVVVSENSRRPWEAREAVGRREPEDGWYLAIEGRGEKEGAEARERLREASGLDRVTGRVRERAREGAGFSERGASRLEVIILAVFGLIETKSWRV